MQDIVTLMIWGVPPSVNHYKRPVVRKMRDGLQRRSYVLTQAAVAFRESVVLMARGQTVAPAAASERKVVRYAISATVYLGPGQRGDGDNFWKCIADSLQHAGVIHSDARVRRWHLDVEDCDREHPRTVICVKRIERRLV